MVHILSPIGDIFYRLNGPVHPLSYFCPCTCALTASLALTVVQTLTPPPCLTAQNVSVFVSVFIRFCPGTNQKDQADCYMLPGQFWSNFGQVLVN